MKLLSSDEESPQIKEGVDHLGVETRPFEARRAKISHLGEHGRRREHILVFNMDVTHTRPSILSERIRSLHRGPAARDRAADSASTLRERVISQPNTAHIAFDERAKPERLAAWQWKLRVRRSMSPTPAGAPRRECPICIVGVSPLLSA